MMSIQVCAVLVFKLVSTDHALLCFCVCLNFNIFFLNYLHAHVHICVFVSVRMTVWTIEDLLIYVSLFLCVWEEGRCSLRVFFSTRGSHSVPLASTHSVYILCVQEIYD